MGRRSAQNPRYQKGKEIGTTRKSASSAKPKRSAGDSGPGKGKSEPAKKSRFFQPLPIPDTAEFKRWRKIWLGLLIAAVIFSVGAWATQSGRFQVEYVGTFSLFAAYACIFGAVYIDVTKIRRMRKEYAAELDRGGKKAPKDSNKDKKKK